MPIKCAAVSIVLLSFASSMACAAGLENTIWRTAKLTGALDPQSCKASPTGIVSFERCEPSEDGTTRICGSIIAFNPNDSELGASRSELAEVKDANNPQEDLRDRTVLGMRLFSGIKMEGGLLTGEAYSPCHGATGRICIEWDGASSTLTQWGCASQASCRGISSILCTKKYRWDRIDAVPDDWIKAR